MDSPAHPLVRPVAPWLLRAGLVVVGVLALGLIFAADGPVRDVVQNHATPAQRRIAEHVSDGTTGAVLLGVALAGWGLGAVLQRRDWRQRWLVVLLATAAAGLAVNVPRALTGRARPRENIEQGWFGPVHDGRLIVGRFNYNSFPSGHTTTAAAFAFALGFCFPRLGRAALPLILLVGWARIWSASHHFSDIMVGLAFGRLLAWCLWRWFFDRQLLAPAPKTSPLDGVPV